VITGWGEAVGSHEQKAAGVDWIVAKPFTADRIVELVMAINQRARITHIYPDLSVSSATNCSQ
jgi:hypothetical protein